MTTNELGLNQNPEDDLLGFRTLAQQSLESIKTDSIGAAAQDPVKPAKPLPSAVVQPVAAVKPQEPKPQTAQSNFDAEFAAILNEGKEEKRKAFLSAWEFAVQSDPERAARAFKIADERGIPRDAVAQNFEIASQILKEEALGIDYDKLQKDSPWTAKSFANPGRLLMSHDDIKQYEEVEAETNSFGDSMKAGYLDLYKGYLGLQIALGLVDKEYDRNDPNQWVSQETRQTLIDLELNLQELRSNPAWYAPIAEEVAQLSVELPASLAVGEATGLAGAGIGSLIAPGPGTAIGQGVGRTVGTVATQGALMAAQEMGIGYLDMRSKGYTHEEALDASVKKSIATGVLDAMSGYVGRIPWRKMMRPGSEIRKSFLEGITKASVREFSDQTKRNIWKESLKDYGKTAFFETTTEVADQAIGVVIESMAYADIKKEDRGRIKSVPALNWEDKQNSDWAKIGEELWTAGRDAAITSAALGILGPAGNYMRSKSQINKALKTESQLQAIIAKASGLKTLERDPEGVKRELQDLMEKNGAANMHIYAEELRDFIRTQDEAIITGAIAESGEKDPAKIAEIRKSYTESPTEKNLRELLPGLMAQLDEATSAEADLTIDSGELLTNMARSQSIRAFTQYARVTQDSISANSARKNAALLDDMKKQADNMLAADRADKAERIASKDRVKQILLGRMLSAGVETETANRSAEYEASFVVVQAENLGMMPHDYLQRYGSEYMSDEEYKAVVDKMKMQGDLPGVQVDYTYTEGDRTASSQYMFAGMQSPTQGDVNLAIQSVEEQIAKLTERKVDPEKIQKLVDWVESAKKFRDSASVVRQQFAGVGALTASREALAQATKRLESGEDPETIRRDTGWFKGRDGKMRFEISDFNSELIHKPDESTRSEIEDAKLGIDADIEQQDAYREKLNNIYGKPKGNRRFTVGEILGHTKLFAAYPWMKSIPIIFPDKGKVNDKLTTTSALQGSYLLADKANWKSMIENEQVPNDVVISMGAMNPNEIRLLLTHELAHVIQSFEGFARGGSPGLAGKVSSDNKKLALNKVLATEANARFVRIRDFAWKLLELMDSSVLDTADPTSKSTLALIEKAGEIPDGMSANDMLKLVDPMIKRLVSKHYGQWLSVRGFKNLGKDDQNIVKGLALKDAKYFWYSLLEGEQEANLAVARMDYTDNMRGYTPPDESRVFTSAASIIIASDSEDVSSVGLPSTVNYKPEQKPSTEQGEDVPAFVNSLVGQDVSYHITDDDADAIDAKVVSVSNISDNIASSSVEIEYLSPDDGEKVTKVVNLSDLSRDVDQQAPRTEGVLESAPGPTPTPEERRKRINERKIADKLGDIQYRARFDIKKMITALTQNADFASIVHESAHSYEILLFKYAEDPDAPILIQQQVMRLLEWANVPGTNLTEKLANYKALPNDKKELISEALTYSYEKYLAEGQAPVEELQQYYATVSRVVRGIYRDVVKTLNEAYKKKYGTDLPGMDGNIRAFFDRMLASEDQIRLTMDLRGMRPVMLSDQQAKLLKISPDELSNLRDLERIAFEESVEQLTAKSIKSLAWVKNKIALKNKELAKQASAVEAKLRVEVEAEFSDLLTYKLLRMFKDGDLSAIDPRLISNPEIAALHKERNDLKSKLKDAKRAKNKLAAKDFDSKIKDLNVAIKAAEKAAAANKDTRPKIDIDSVERLFPKQLGEQGKSSAKFEEIKAKLKSGRSGVLSKNGVDVNAIASIYGFDTPVEMIDQLAYAPPFEEAVEKRVKERMLAEHSELADVKKREEAVIEAIHNEARLKLIATQHGIIQKALGAQVGAVTPGVMSGVEASREEMFGLRLEIEKLEQDRKDAIESGTQDVVDDIDVLLLLKKDDLARIEKKINIPNASLAEIMSTARVAARDLLKKVNIADYDYKAWQLREERLAKRAAEALKDGDLNMALLLTKQQMIAHEMVSQTLQLRKEAGGIAEFFRRFGEHTREDARRRDTDRIVLGLEMLRLSGYDFTKRHHDRDVKAVIDNNPGLIEEYQHLFDIIKEDADKRRNRSDPSKTRSLNIEELRVLHNIMLGVWNNATMARTAIMDNKRILLEEADAMLVDQIRSLYGHLRNKPNVDLVDPQGPQGPLMPIEDVEIPPYEGDGEDGGGLIPPESNNGLVEGVPNFANGQSGADSYYVLENDEFLGLTGWLSRMQHWCEYMDGNRPDGPFTRLFWRPIKYAILNYKDAKLVYYERINRILDPIRRDMTWHPIDARQHFDYVFRNKMELLGAIQHMGNPSNLDEMCRNRDWDPDDFRAFIIECWRDGTVTREDMDAIQAIWNENNRLLPESQRVHYQLYGVRYTPIPANQIQTPWGTYPGGYIPIVRDPMDPRVTKGQEAGIQNAIARLYGDAQVSLPTTGRSWALNRGGNRGWVVMDIGLSNQHVDSVLRFIHLMPPVRSVTEIYGNRNGLFGRALRQVNRMALTKIVHPYLERVVRQSSTLPSSQPVWDRIGQKILRNTGTDVMFGLAQNALANISGLVVYANRHRGDPLAKGLVAEGMLRALFTTNFSTWVNNQSQLVRQRHDTRAREMQLQTARLLKDPSRSFGFTMSNPFAQFMGRVKDATFGRASDWYGVYGYILQRVVQDPLDRAVWYAEYEYHQRRSMSNGAPTLTHEELVRRADAAVELTQGSSEPENVSQAETGTVLWKTFTPLMSWMNMMLNHSGGKIATVLRSFGFDLSNIQPRHAAAMATIYMTSYFLPLIIGNHVNLMAAGGLKDSDEDGTTWDDYFKWLMRGMAMQPLQGVPIAGNLLNTFVNQFDDIKYNDRVGSVPVINAFESAYRTIGNVVDYFGNDEPIFQSGRDFKDFATTFALFTGVHIKPFVKPLAYKKDIEVKRARPVDGWDYWRGMVTGTVSPESRR